MPHADFVHLRVHSAYSLSEGAIKVKALARLCREHALPAVAVTDSSNLFGALEISQTMLEAGVQPIIGCQLALRREDEESYGSPRPEPDQIILLAQSETGYQNLLQLVSDAYLTGEPS
jgi:DNA polymerase-3 subunit alpha